MGLEKYTGDWNKITAKHLLNRATFLITRESIDKFTNQGLDASVNELLQDLPLPPPPVNYSFTVDPNVPIGETWVDKPELESAIVHWHRTLVAWGNKNIVDEECSAREKMTLFWHNHFVSALGMESVKYRYQYLSLLREYCFGNFRDLTKKMTVNASILSFLNGDTNTSSAPNENYARELFELFTVGKGALVAPGDYSTFTESDILEASKILTGWTTEYDYLLPEMPSPKFNADLHDSSTKQLSGYFNNAVIDDMGENEYKRLIDVIFESENTAINIVRDIYIWFVHYEIDEIIEVEIIAPLAEILRDADYNIKPVLKALFESAHFYNNSFFGSKIKSPIELLLGFTKTFIELPEPIKPEHRICHGLYFETDKMGQAVSKVPTVAGWKAYYQSPNFYRTWINSITLPLRMSFLEGAIDPGLLLVATEYKVDVLKFVETLSYPNDPNTLISELSEILYSNPLGEQQLISLKQILIPGLPDFEWTVEYDAYLLDPLNEEKRTAVEKRLQNLFVAMVLLPEYQLH